MSNTSRLEIDATAFVSPESYGAGGYPHELWTTLRNEDPVHWCEPEGHRPFWAITKHADVKSLSAQPDLFSSAPRFVLMPEKVERATERTFPGSENRGHSPLRGLINMDPPEHREYRKLAGPFFRPRTLRRLEDHMREVTRRVLAPHAGASVELDFVDDIAQWHPLRLICEILGVAAEHEGVISQLTSTLFAPEDDEYAPKDHGKFYGEMLDYFISLITSKRDTPGDDLATVLVQADIDGVPLPEMELISYLVVIATAGHHTTRNALAGGMHALLAHPDQLDRLQSDPSLVVAATEEIVRWTSPITHFMRTATEDTEVRGRQIRAGESVALFYPSANRDEEVFDVPFEFRIDRDPNPHLGFGVGEHFCLGASLAKMEIRILLEELLPRLRQVELAGSTDFLQAHFVGGIKHLPLRWTVDAHAGYEG